MDRKHDRLISLEEDETGSCNVAWSVLMVVQHYLTTYICEKISQLGGDSQNNY